MARREPEREKRTPGRPEMGAETAGGGGRAGRELGTPLALPLGAGRGPPERRSCVRLEIKGSRGREQNLEQL